MRISRSTDKNERLLDAIERLIKRVAALEMRRRPHTMSETSSTRPNRETRRSDASVATLRSNLPLPTICSQPRSPKLISGGHQTYTIISLGNVAREEGMST